MAFPQSQRAGGGNIEPEPPEAGQHQTDLQRADELPPTGDQPLHAEKRDDKQVNQRRIVPAEMWPDEECTENGGKGWGVEVIAERRKYSRVRFAEKPDGQRYVCRRVD